MPARLSPRPLFAELIRGLRLRRNIGIEPEDRLTKFALFGIPIALFFACLVAGISLPKGDQLLAGGALLVGAFLASFAQLAGWRERLTARSRKVDGAEMRAIDEAVAHVLVSVLASVVLCGSLVVETNVSTPFVAVPASALAVALLTYLGLTLLVVVNLLHDAYRAANPYREPLTRPGSEQPQDDRKLG